MFGQSLLSAFGSAACTTDTDQLFTVPTSTASLATYELNSNANSIPYNQSVTSIATYQLNNATTSIPSNTYPGTPSNITYAAGKFGNAAVFNGSSSVITLPLSNWLASTSAKSCSVWFKTSVTSGGNRAIVSDYGDGSAFNFDCFLKPSSGKIEISSRRGTNYYADSSSGNFNDGNWHLAVIVDDIPNSSLKLYVDNNLEVSISTGSASINSSVLYIGTYSSGYYFDGSIDQVRIFDKALSSTERTTLYNETTTTAQSASISYPVSYNGTASNITYAAGKFGNAAVFNGSNSTITISPPEAQAFNFTTPTSLSVWVNRNTTNRDFIIDKGNGSSGSYGWQFEYNYSEYVFQLNNTAGGIMDLRATASGTGSWEHIVVTYDSNQVGKIYLNGVLKATDTMSGTVSFNTNGVTIGKYSLASGYEFDGKLDQIRFFNTALPQSAVTALYNETTTTAQSNNIDYQLANPNSVAYYKMSDATDQLGNYNGTATNVNFNTEGKFGFAGAFNGSSSVITLPAAFSSTYEGSTTWSFSAWVDVNSSNADKNFFTKYNSSVQVGGIQIGTDASGYLNFFVADTSDNRQHNRGNTALSTNTWHHICVIWSSGTMYLYLNGSAETLTNLSNTYTGSTIPTTTTSSTKSNRFGAVTYGGGSTSYSDIKLDQIRIYDAALSAADVSTLYKEVECEPAAINALDHFNTVLYTGNGGTQSVTGVGFKPGLSWVKNRNTSGNSHELADVIRGVDNTLNSNTTSGEYNNATYQFNSFDTDGITVTDDAAGNYAVNGNNETYVAWNWKAPLANLSTSFNGSSSQITLLDSLGTAMGNNNFSVSFWVNVNSASQDAIYLSITRPYDFYVATFSGVIYLNLGTLSYSTGISLSTGWHHIAVTKSSSSGSILYLDNNATADASKTGNITANNIANSIGNYNNGSYVVDGKMGQVRIFNDVLTASEVSDLYTEPAASNNTLNYPAGAGCIAAYPLQTNAVDLSGNYSGASSNVTFGQPGYLTSNTDGTITTAIAANVEAGFNIISYSGNGIAGATVGHGLGQQVKLAFFKNRTTGSTYWYVYSDELSGSTYNLYLNTADTETADNVLRGGNATTIEISNSTAVNATNNNYICYAWASIPGYSRVGSYIGQTAGVTIYTGFQPRFIMVKASQATYPENWAILDAVRGSGKCLNPNLSNAETDSTLNTFTTTATGFSFPHQNTADAMLNENGYKYIFLAIA